MHPLQADFHYARGAIQAAFKCYVRSRDYCTSPRQVAPLRQGLGTRARRGRCFFRGWRLVKGFMCMRMLHGPTQHT